MWFRKKLDNDRADELDSQIRGMKRVLQDLTADVEELREKFVTLRGMIYAKKLHKAESEDTAPASNGRLTREQKAELLRNFVPGRPYPHKG